jgi:hypothetical protein
MLWLAFNKQMNMDPSQLSSEKKKNKQVQIVIYYTLSQTIVFLV